MTEAAIAPRAGFEMADNVEFHLHDRNDDHLRQAHARIDRKGLITAVPAGNEYLPLIIGIDESNRVSQNDSVFMTEPRTGQNNCRQIGIIDMNGNAGRYQLSLPRFNEQRLLNTSAKINASRTRRRVLRQWIFAAEPLVEETELNLSFCQDEVGLRMPLVSTDLPLRL